MAEKLFMLALSPTMSEGVIARWIKKEGDCVSSGDILCEVETDKATMEYECSSDGEILKVIVPDGAKAAVGDVIAVIGSKGEDISGLLNGVLPEPQKTAQRVAEKGLESQLSIGGNTTTSSYIVDENIRIKASPLAKVIAKRSGIDLSSVTGTGPGGRIIKRDLENIPPIKLKTSELIQISVDKSGSDEIISLSGKRKVIAQRLSESKFTAPHYYLKLKINVGGLVKARGALVKSSGEKVSMNAFLIKFAAETIKKHPFINATWNGDTIIKHSKIDIGLAVALKDGLITPVVRDCGNKGVLNIHDELKLLIDKALNNSLTPEEYTNATFTISNLGSYGIEEFTAIINPPGSAIMAVGEIIKEPAVNENDQITIISNMKVTLSCDHRVIDGAVGASFLRDFKTLVEYPVSVLY